MRKYLFIACMIGMLVMLTGCPVGVPHPLGTPGKEKINRTLIGTWYTPFVEAEVISFKLDRVDDFSYKVEILELGEGYGLQTSFMQGWVTQVDGWDFFYAKPADDPNYYVFCYILKGKDKIVTYDVALKVGGAKSVTSTEEFRKELSASLKVGGCLINEKLYIRK